MRQLLGNGSRRSLRWIASSVCTFVALSSSGLHAGNEWPAFRGPYANGHADGSGLPVTWSESENIRWHTPLEGRAWSSPVVWDDQIWLTNATEDGHELSVLRLDLESGEVTLNKKLFDVETPPEIHKFNSYASVTPVIEEGRIYVSWGSLGLACLDTQTGDVLWSRRDLECDHYRGPGASPILYDGMLIQNYDGFDFQFVIALDKQTGETIWRKERPHNFETDNGDYKKAYATPIVIEVDGRQQLISPTSKGTFAYDPYTGDELWRVRYEGFSTATRPLYEHGLLYISTGFSRAEMVAVRPTGEGDVTDTHIVWLEKKLMPSKPAPLLIGERMYTVSDEGVATCLNALTGEQVWQARVGGNYSASPVYADGRIYFLSEDGKTTVIEPADEYKVLAENLLGDGFMASPAVVDRSLILRSRSGLYRVENGSQPPAGR